MLPSLRKIAAKLLTELARIKMVGRKAHFRLLGPFTNFQDLLSLLAVQKLLLALEKVRRHLVEKKGKEEGGPIVRKRERFRILVNLIGKKQDQDSTEVWEEKTPRATATKERDKETPSENAENGGAGEKDETTKDNSNHVETGDEVWLLARSLNSCSYWFCTVNDRRCGRG